MAKPTVIAGTKLLLLVGDGASPEVFAEPCGLTTKSFDLAASTNTTVLPDCDDPEAAAWEATDINALSASGSGTGVMAAESFSKWNDWFLSTEGKNMQIKLDHADLGYYAGSFKLTSFKLAGTRGNKVTVDISFKGDGEVTWVDNP
jgi:predicted secreted protein